jgi:hypothetical protein
MKPSEQKIADLAYSFYSWNPEEINRLNSFFRTRNIIKSKELRKLVLKIGDAVRNNQTHDKYFTLLKEMLPQEEEQAPNCIEIKPVLNFLNKNLWKSFAKKQRLRLNISLSSVASCLASAKVSLPLLSAAS